MAGSVIINKPRMVEILDDLLATNSLQSIRLRLAQLCEDLNTTARDQAGLLNIDENGETIKFSRQFLLGEFNQIQETQTLERTKYYLERLKKAVCAAKTSKINDMDLNRWKEYDDIITDSLWILEKRDTSGKHSAWYWGNFIPQIPNQLMRRYTKKGDWVVDPFVGSGTTLLECQRLERNGLGVELQTEVAAKARQLLDHRVEVPQSELFTQRDFETDTVPSTKTIIEVGDSAEVDFADLLKQHGAKSAQLLIMHPPYHDIIRFSQNPQDLSNAPSTQTFVAMFGRVVDNTFSILDKGRYLAVVIGDKYYRGEWIPLGFMLMSEVLKRDYTLKSVIVKNFEDTLGKRNQKELWRYRALVGGFYIFKHEYIFLFRKGGGKSRP
jgi:hypothetical protein